MIIREMILFSLLCLGALFFNSSEFVDTGIVPKWYMTIAMGIVLVVYYLILSQRKRSFSFEMQGIIYAIIISCALQALYGILQYWGVLQCTSSFRITGSFDNPAGFASSLCAGIPFLWFVWNGLKGWKKLLCVMTILLLVCGVFLSGSRAGVLSIFMLVAIWGYQSVSWNKLQKIVLVIGALVVLIVFLYFLKRNSADGRLLIWICCLNMIAIKPWFGFGSGGFEAHYMDYQAQFFHRNPDSGYAILADTVQQPFNEFLRIAVDYGLGGLLGLLGMIVFLILCYQKCNSCYKDLAALSLCSITVFSLFSYPFLYPFTWAVVLLDLVILAGNTWHIHWKIFSVVGKWLVILCVMGSLCITNTMVIRVKAEMKWKHALSLSSCGLFEKAQPLYDAAERVLGNDRYFLYNYAAELNVARFYKESLDIAMKCRHLWSDYDLEMLIAQNCWEINRMVEAEEYFRLASDMCPNRFMPLYRLVWLLDRQGRQTEARELATIIISKPVEIPSVIIERIKSEMENYLTLKI